MHTFNCYHRADRRVKGWVRIHGGFMADSWRIHGGKAKGFIKPLALGFNGFLSCVCSEWFFWDGLNPRF